MNVGFVWVAHVTTAGIVSAVLLGPSRSVNISSNGLSSSSWTFGAPTTGKKKVSFSLSLAGRKEHQKVSKQFHVVFACCSFVCCLFLSLFVLSLQLL